MVIPGFSSYDISEDGVVTNIESGMVVRSYHAQSSKYYKYVRVSLIGDDGKRHACNVIRLLALAYVDKPSAHCVARAKDGNNLNATLSNVVWEPYAYCTKRAWERGAYANRTPKKSACCTVESMELVRSTLEELDRPTTASELSRILDVPYTTVRYSLRALITHGKVRHIERKGFELIK